MHLHHIIYMPRHCHRAPLTTALSLSLSLSQLCFTTHWRRKLLPPYNSSFLERRDDCISKRHCRRQETVPLRQPRTRVAREERGGLAGEERGERDAGICVAAHCYARCGAIRRGAKHRYCGEPFDRCRRALARTLRTHSRNSLVNISPNERKLRARRGEGDERETKCVPERTS